MADIFLMPRGAIVTPGLIDMNFEAEHYSGIFAEPIENILKRGITTVIGSVKVYSGGRWGNTGKRREWRNFGTRRL